MDIGEPSKTPQDAVNSLFARQKERSRTQRLTSTGERKTLLKRFEHFLLINQQRIVDEIHKDFKKPPEEVLLSELYPVLTEIRHAVDHLSDWGRPKKIDAPLTYLGTRSEVLYEAKGVCLIIAPWNFPFNLCLGPLISCLAAGNTAILKPSELTPVASALIVQLVAEFFEPGLVDVVEGGIEVSTLLLKLPFDHIFFTGSPHVGKIVMKAAAENLTSVTLELGGKSPTIIDQTADIKDAARRIAFGKFLNNGQTCIAPDYVLVEESVKQQFVEELIKSVTAMFGANGTLGESSPAYARIVDEKNFMRLKRLLEDAIARGAKVEWSGPINENTFFIHPVILTSIGSDSGIMNEEIFGPLLPIVPFKSVEEVVNIVNARPKPLALYIFSRDKRFREQISRRTSSGAVCINDCIIQFSHPDLPFGGVNNSGIGKAHGQYGFLSFSNEKPSIRQRRGLAASYFIQPPYTKLRRKIIEFMIRWA